MKFDLHQSLAALRGKLTKTRLLGLGAVALAALTLTSCGAAGFPVTGVVLDSGTKQPLANVWVVQEWVILSPGVPFLQGASYSPCARVQVARTDATGRFVLEKPAGFTLPSGYTSAKANHLAHAVGYEREYDGGKAEKSIAKPNFGFTQEVEVWVKKIASRDEIVDKVFDVLNVKECGFQPTSFAQVEESLLRALVQRDVTPEELADASIRNMRRLQVSVPGYQTRDFQLRGSFFVRYKAMYTEMKAKQ